jgi:glutamine synthetase
MPGSSQSLSGPNFVLNTIVADALSEIADELEGAKNLNVKVQSLLKKYAVEHEAVIFNGDNYSEAWVVEAAKRGLPNIRNCVDGINAMTDKENAKVLIKHGTLPKGEIHARHEILLENYIKTINIEAKTMLAMARREILPAVINFTTTLANSVNAVEAAGVDAPAQAMLLQKVNDAATEMSVAIDELADTVSAAAGEAAVGKKAVAYRDSVIPAMVALRKVSDGIEPFIAAECWPLPTYADMLFYR